MFDCNRIATLIYLFLTTSDAKIFLLLGEVVILNKLVVAVPVPPFTRNIEVSDFSIGKNAYEALTRSPYTKIAQ